MTIMTICDSCAHGLCVIIKLCDTNLYFMHYLHVVIVLLNMSLYKSSFSTYSFEKLGFFFLCYSFYVSISFWILAFILWFYVLNWMSFLIMSDLITLFKFFLILLNDQLKYKNCAMLYIKKTEFKTMPGCWKFLPCKAKCLVTKTNKTLKTSGC